MPERRYGEDQGSRGGLIVAVMPRSDGERAGLLAGDVVIAVDGRPVLDVIDWQWATDEDAFEVTVMRSGEPLTLRVQRTWAGPVGVDFDGLVFDGIRECVNACSFCFVAQLPPGLRPQLAVRDDDFRLSFLLGNFITLTNLTEQDIERVLTQRLSPLYVSLHAVDQDVRRSLVCCTTEDTTVERLERLLAAGLAVHIQIVAVPRVNDGAVLEETLTYLASHPGVLSVGIVPLGFTAHQRRYERSFDPAESAALLDIVEAWQARMRRERGSGWVYAADEFVLSAGRELPPAAAYDDFPQYENGIGMLRAFLDELALCAVTLPGIRRDRFVAVTGMLFEPVLRRALQSHGLRDAVRVLGVKNRMFGGNVSVAGLLSGRDIVDAVVADGAVATYLVPDVVVNSDGLLLDDMPASDLASRSGADIRLIPPDATSLCAAVRGNV